MRWIKTQRAKSVSTEIQFVLLLMYKSGAPDETFVAKSLIADPLWGTRGWILLPKLPCLLQKHPLCVGFWTSMPTFHFSQHDLMSILYRHFNIWLNCPENCSTKVLHDHWQSPTYCLSYISSRLLACEWSSKFFRWAVAYFSKSFLIQWG